MLYKAFKNIVIIVIVILTFACKSKSDAKKEEQSLIESFSYSLFSVRLERCEKGKFCLDCGDKKAGYQEIEFRKLEEHLNRTLNFESSLKLIKFQILVDSNGKGCVLSHTDFSNHPTTQQMIKTLNDFNQWIPAVKNGRKEAQVSINVVFTIKGNKITSQIERMDAKAFKKLFEKPMSPEIHNHTYFYKNENLHLYNITTWNMENSNLPNEMNDCVSIDKYGVIWLSIDNGLVKFDGNKFQNVEQDIPDKEDYFYIRTILTDNHNTKWICSTSGIYSFDDKKWIKYDEDEIGVKGGYKMVYNSQTDEIFICSGKGLVILKNGKWKLLNQRKNSELPSDGVYFAKRDSKNRLWIGTFEGTIMIDENGQTTNFEKTTTILQGKCITNMDEDQDGNLYFALYEHNRKDPQKTSKAEGFVIRYPDGSFKQFNSYNSGMPFDRVSSILYDKTEKVLWLSTNGAGLIRYDLKDGWENYHNENTMIPNNYILTMIFGNEGNLYLATRGGLVKIERK